MGEIEIVSKGLGVKFEGVFSLKGVCKVLDDYFGRLGYDKDEPKSIEAMKASGKYVTMVIEFKRRLNDYVKAIHKVTIKGENITQLDVKKGDTRHRMNKGKVEIEVDTFLESDYETRWEGKPLYYFLRLIWQRYVWAPMQTDFKGQTGQISQHAIAEVKAYLNLGKF